VKKVVFDADNKTVSWSQGDQIGRIFTHWVTVYFSEIIEILKKYTTFLGDFSTVKVI
jgi:hypothetical protein